MPAAAALTPSTTLSNMELCTYRRDPAVQTWPALKKIAPALPPATACGSASGSTIIGDLPPSSSDTRLRLSVALLLISLPTSVEPVNAILSTPACATSAAPVVSPSPVKMLTTPGGKPASRIRSPRRSADSGVCSAGFSTQVQPTARAGPNFQAAMANGKFQGTICPTTPTGSRATYVWYLAPGGMPIEVCMVVPSIFVAQPAM